MDVEIEIDVGDHIILEKFQSSPPWSIDGNPITNRPPSEKFWNFNISGEVGEWLRNHDHPGVIRVYKESDEITVMFDDARLAMLFKLTWL